MFGRKKNNLEAQKLREEQFKKEELEREAKEHEKLKDRYYKAREYDRRIALGEDPLVVEAEVYGFKDLNAEKSEDEVVASNSETVFEEDDEKEEISVPNKENDTLAASKEKTEASETTNKNIEEKEALETTSIENENIEEKEDITEKTEEPALHKTVRKSQPKKTSSKEVEDGNEKVLVEADPNDKTNGKYEIFQESGGFKYRIVASNGQILATSEVYTKATGAKDGIKTLKSNLDSLMFHVETDKHRKSQFMATTPQNKTLVTSANYSTKKSAESAIDSFKKFALATKIVLLNNEDESKPEIVDRSQFSSASGKGKYVILFNQNGLTYQFALKASNGQVIVTSKFYKSDVSCKAAITKFKKDVKEGTFYTVKDKNGNYEFRLYNSSNKLVQSGTSFTTKTKCLANIESVIRFIDSDVE